MWFFSSNFSNMNHEFVAYNKILKLVHFTDYFIRILLSQMFFHRLKCMYNYE